jgi:molecular chaperone GrpE (heat shock protein)
MGSNLIESNENPSAALNLIEEAVSGKSSSPQKEQANNQSLPKLSALEEEIEAQKAYIEELKENYAEIQRKLANKYSDE